MDAHAVIAVLGLLTDVRPSTNLIRTYRECPVDKGDHGRGAPVLSVMLGGERQEVFCLFLFGLSKHGCVAVSAAHRHHCRTCDTTDRPSAQQWSCKRPPTPNGLN